MKSCALTGHRVLDSNFDEYALVEKLESLIEEGYDHFLCGMAIGFDLLALSHLVEIKKKSAIILEACVPFEGQDGRFHQKDQKKYRELLQECDRVKVFFPTYQEGCYLIRDRYLVENADLVLAYCAKKKGGTYYTVKYAQKMGVPVFNISAEIL